MNIRDLQNEEKKLKKKTIRKARFTVTICASACALVLILQIVFAFTFPSVENEILSILLDMAMFVLYIGVPFGIAELILRIIRKKEFYVKKESSFPKAPPLYVFGAIGAGYLINFIVNLFFRSWVESYDVEFALPTSVVGLILYFIMQSVFPAFLEEFAFRGVILKNLLPYGKKGAIFLSSLFFGIAHIDPPRIIFATIFGMLLAICYEKTRSLKIPILIHFLNNAIATIATISSVHEEMIIITLLLSLLTLALMGCGAIAIAFYAIAGVSKKKYSINKPANLGYRLSFGNYANVSLLNVGVIAYLLIFLVYFCLVF